MLYNATNKYGVKKKIVVKTLVSNFGYCSRVYFGNQNIKIIISAQKILKFWNLFLQKLTYVNRVALKIHKKASN